MATVLTNGDDDWSAWFDIDHVVEALDGDDDLIAAGGNDIIFAGAGFDFVLGGRGNDELYGEDGVDFMFGDIGDDVLFGGDDNDELFGDDGDDVVNGGEGDDYLEGGADNDTLRGDAGDDHLFGGSHGDSLSGGGGNDLLDGGTGGDNMRGGVGDDGYVVDNAADNVIELEDEGFVDGVFALITFTLPDNVENMALIGEDAIDGTGNELNNEMFGNDNENTLNGEDGSDELFGADGGDTLNGGAGGDDLHGEGGDDILNGGGGFDWLYGYAGDDDLDGEMMFGMADNDTYIVDNANDTVFETANQGTDEVIAQVSFRLVADVENLTLAGGFSAALNGTGNGLGNAIAGNEFGNTIDGGFGNDTLDGGEGLDTVSFQSWDPTGLPGPQLETVRIQLQQGGVQGTATRTLNLPLGNPLLESDNLTGFENVRGSNRTETIVGNSGNNMLEGRGGSDVLEGKGGSDTLDGGSGVDTATYETDSGRVFVSLADGNANGSATQTVTLPTGQLIIVATDTLRSIENVIGSAHNDIIAGNGSANVLDGRGGADQMSGRGGNDTYVVDSVADLVIEQANEGIDTVKASVPVLALAANVENVTLLGSADLLATGNNLDNVMIGNSGANRLTGGGGVDTLTGGGGADTFVFLSTADSSQGAPDQIVDFVSARFSSVSDSIDLSQIDANVNADGDQQFLFIGNDNEFSPNLGTGQLRCNGGFVEGDVDGDLVADFRIQVFQQDNKLIEADFIL